MTGRPDPGQPPVPAEHRHSADAFRRGEHYDALYDRASAEGYLARNRATVAVLAAIGAGSVVTGVVLIAFGAGATRLLVILGVFGLVVMLLTLPTMVNVGRRLRNLHTGDGLFARVSLVGVEFALTGRIDWEEISAVVVFDDTERVRRVRRIPLIGWGVEISRRAGNGAKGVSFALKNGQAVQSRIADPARRGFVRLWGPSSDPARAGDVSLILDPLLDERGVVAFTEAVVTAATLSGVAVVTPRSSAEYLRTLGRLLDPKWPAGH